MSKITVDKEKCKGCLLCVNVCPKGLIVLSGQLNQRGLEPVKFKDGSECLGCCRCAIICPDCCIEVYR